MPRPPLERGGAGQPCALTPSLLLLCGFCGFSGARESGMYLSGQLCIGWKREAERGELGFSECHTAIAEVGCVPSSSSPAALTF